MQTKRNAKEKLGDSDVLILLDDALCKDTYPNPDHIDLIDLKEWDRQTKQVFLWVSSLFTNEEEVFLTKYFRENLHNRALIAYCISDHYFGYENDSEDSD